MVNLPRLRQNVDAVRARIAAACARAGRDPESVTLIVVTKTVSPEVIPLLAELGVTDIGENRALEALDRIGPLQGFRRHMVGRLQTNKAVKALQWADMIHSVDRTSLIRELSRHNKKIQAFVQVNVSGEASKGGFPPDLAEAAVEDARRSLPVAGLMTMAPEGADSRPYFRRLREMAARSGLPGLSMGMSQDFEVAVEEGSTHVRVGTAIFEGV